MTSHNTFTAWHPWLRPIAWAVVAAHVALALQPLSALAREQGTGPYNPGAQAQLQRLAQWQQRIEVAKVARQQAQASPADRASADLARIQELTQTLVSDQRARGLSAPLSPPAAASRGNAGDAGDAGTGQPQLRAVGPDMRISVQSDADTGPAVELPSPQRAEQERELQQLISGQAAAQAAIREEFEATRQHLLQKNLPAEILARHDEAVRQMHARQRQFQALAESLARATTPAQKAAALEALHAHLQRHPNQRQAPVREPSALPWRSPEPTSREPADTPTSWHQQLFGHERVHLAQAGGQIGPLRFSTLPAPDEAPTLADLGETDEIELTAQIRALAAKLGHNPVQIHNWVRHHIDWVPTWGAIQTAQATLDKRSGNAVDIAGLQIALLRAANIPARYQFGTVEIDPERLRNWVGGVASAQAAQQLLGQGGIANRALVEGGRVVRVRMEHAWVSAYVHWAPGRGQRNATAEQHPSPEASLNAWVPLDASFKQYAYSAGMDLAAQVPLDSQALLDAVRQGASVDESQGWVQNLNLAALQQALQARRRPGARGARALLRRPEPMQF